MKVIQTKHNGYHFRSRLEARWAVFFDTLGISYEYEPEGFELSNGVRYLPDFSITEKGDVVAYIEIKGKDPTYFEKEKVVYLSEDTSVPVYILNEFPYWDYELGYFAFPMYVGLGISVGDWIKYDTIAGDYAETLPEFIASMGGKTDTLYDTFEESCKSYLKDTGKSHPNHFPVGLCSGEHELGRIPDFVYCKNLTVKQILEASRAAKSARFEFGGK